MVNAKEDLKARQQKNKKSLFASDAEEFMALGANSSGRAGAARFYGLFWQGRIVGRLYCVSS
jgi:hypothetical protein